MLLGPAERAGAATTLKLITHVGNGTKGKVVQIADRAASKLVGPRGSGLTRGVTPTEVKIGCVDNARSYPGYQTGIEAEFNAVNGKGGIDGRKLVIAGTTCQAEYFGTPTTTDPNTTTTTPTSEDEVLVTQDTAFAVLSLVNYMPKETTSYLNDHQVPYVGWGSTPGFCGYRWGFGWDGDMCATAETEPIEAIAGNLVEALLKATKIHPKALRFAVESQRSQESVAEDDQYAAEVKKLGGKVVYAADNYSGDLSTSLYVRTILGSHPNVVFLPVSFTAAVPLVAGLKSAGYTGVIMDFTSYIPGLLPTLSPQYWQAIQGLYVNTQVVPPRETTLYDATIENDLSATGAKPTITIGSFVGFAEAEMLVGMIKAAGPNLNTKTFTRAVNNPKKPFTSFTTAAAGGPGKLVWPAGHYLPADCASIVRAGDTGFTVVEPFGCHTTFLVTKK